MKVQETVRKETVNIALGCISLTALMLLVFLLLKSLDLPVLIGALLGFAAGVLDFFLLGLTVQKAAELQAKHPIPKKEASEDDEDEEESGTAADPETAALIRRKVQKSYFARRLMLIAVAALGLTKFVSLPAVVIPMLFPKIVIQFRNLFLSLKKGGNNT